MSEAELSKRHLGVAANSPGPQTQEEGGPVSALAATLFKIIEIAKAQLRSVGATNARPNVQREVQDLVPPHREPGTMCTDAHESVPVVGRTDEGEHTHARNTHPQTDSRFRGTNSVTAPRYGIESDTGSFHFTKGVLGPEFCNRFADNMDFDMTVLWIASWCRRSADQRRALLDEVVEFEAFKRRFTDPQQAQRWRQAMANALDIVAGKLGDDQAQSPSIHELTRFFEEWNQQGGVLRDDGGEDLLQRLGDDPELEDCVVAALMGSVDENGGLFTNPHDQYPAWKALNIFRHWSTIGRQGKLKPYLREARISDKLLDRYLTGAS